MDKTNNKILTIDTEEVMERLSFKLTHVNKNMTPEMVDDIYNDDDSYKDVIETNKFSCSCQNYKPSLT
jgi:hypothetical protein